VRFFFRSLRVSPNVLALFTILPPAYCLQVLLHPMPRSARWNQQLSPYLLQVNDQLLLQPSSVLLSVVRALHVLRGVLQEVGAVQHGIA
jgi:hypothetical protein